MGRRTVPGSARSLDVSPLGDEEYKGKPAPSCGHRRELRPTHLMRYCSARCWTWGQEVSKTRYRATTWLTAFALLTPLPALSADFTREQVAEQLAALPNGGRINLAGKSLGGLDLSRLDFTGGDLHGADLSGTNLFAAKFQDANLSGANLSGASMGIMNVIRADLTDANLTGADLHQADFIGANLAGANLTGANAAGTNFEAAEIKDAIGLESVKSLDRKGAR